jgi:hypothetical protein
MNARTLIIMAGVIVALAAPAVASAKLSPAAQYQKSLAAKKHAAKNAKQVFKRQGQSRQIYTYYPAPAYQGELSLAEIEAGYNLDLIAHALDSIQFPDTSTAPAASDDASAVTMSDNSSSDNSSSSTTSDSTPASDASFAATPATSMVAVDDSADC